jgi:MoaA/NifB/PqqE/SkfB family radical SAM enzyme
MSPRLRTVVIKPTLRCTANCFGCARRRDLHKSLAKENHLQFEDWQRIIAEAAELGMNKFVISGGEPTLDKNLVKLVAEGAKYAKKVSVNTNGSLMTQELAEALLAAGLTSVMLSLYSHEPEVHNGIRRSKNLWKKAVETARILTHLRDTKYPDFRLRTQAVILRENYKTLDELITFHHEIGANRLNLAYLAGDYEGEYLLTAEEITEFREHSIPKVLAALARLDLPDLAATEEVVRGLYHPDLGSLEDLAKGVYWKDKPCKIPKRFTILLADGQVHPCNIVEHTHEPVMGNLFDSSLGDIFKSKQWAKFVKHRFDMCPMCPMNLNPLILLR